MAQIYCYGSGTALVGCRRFCFSLYLKNILQVLSVFEFVHVFLLSICIFFKYNMEFPSFLFQEFVTQCHCLVCFDMYKYNGCDADRRCSYSSRGK